MKDAEASKLRILCLHGMRQTKEIFRTRLGRLVKKLRKSCVLEIPDAPFKLDLEEDQSIQTLTWMVKTSEADRINTFNESLDMLHTKYWKFDQKPFDGILGFSMGASVASALLYDQKRFQGLSFGIMFSGPKYDFIFDKNRMIEIPTLHVFGKADAIVSPDRSKSLAVDVFVDPVIYEHPLGHCIPSKSADQRIVLDFVNQFLTIKKNEAYIQKNNDNAIQQRDEICTLMSIYSEVQVYQKDKILTDTDLDENDESIFAMGSVCPTVIYSLNDNFKMKFKFLGSYPETMLDFDVDCVGFNLTSKKIVIEEAYRIMNSLEGTCCVYSMIEGVSELISNMEENKITEEVINAEDVKSWWEVYDPEDENNSNLAKAALKRSFEMELSLSNEFYSNFARKFKGRFIVGLVGKPSAGKSTFFNSATIMDSPAKVGAHPFTTIEPNFGTGWWSSNDCSDARSNTDTIYGRDYQNRRILPLTIKDIAGLIPGAYKGYGKGNMFLNDLLDADVLVHVVDASGNSDAQGNDLREVCSNDFLVQVKNDIHWVYAEIHLWILNNVVSKWKSVVHASKHENELKRLKELFSGYQKCASEIVEVIYNKLGKKNLIEWCIDDVHNFVALFLRLRFPICVAFNKVDKLTENQLKLLYEYQLELFQECHLKSALCSAKLEAKFFCENRNLATSYNWAKYLDADVKGIVPKGNFGVLEAINKAIYLRQPLIVYPNNLGIEGFGFSKLCLQCVRGTTIKRIYERLRDDTYGKLKKPFLTGEFVRCEVFLQIDNKSLPVGRTFELTPNSNRIKIYTNKKHSKIIKFD